MKNWLKKQIIAVSMAMGNVEKQVLTQDGLDLSNNSGTHQNKNQNSLMEALLRGELTQEVKEFRWAMYKAFRESKSRQLIPLLDEEGKPKTDADGNVMFRVEYSGDEAKLKQIKTDETDEYKLIMVVDNATITKSKLEVFDSVDGNLDTDEELLVNTKETRVDLDNHIVVDSDTEVDGKYELNESLFIKKNDEVKVYGFVKDNRNGGYEKPINITREMPPKFKIENYAEKLHVKSVDEANGEFLLEFYLSKYPDPHDRKTNLLISDIKKIIEKYRYNSMLDFKSVEYVTNNTVGVQDYLYFKFDIIKFEKITEFNRFYVIKFLAKVIENGIDLVEQYVSPEMEEKYNNKAEKKK
jgi:hypothetical protein